MEVSDAFMKNMATRMFGKFEKYWSEFSTIMAIATVLDLRYKYQFGEWAYKKVYGDSYDIELSLLKEKLFALYGDMPRAPRGFLHLLIQLLAIPNSLAMWSRNQIHSWTLINIQVMNLSLFPSLTWRCIWRRISYPVLKYLMFLVIGK